MKKEKKHKEPVRTAFYPYEVFSVSSTLKIIGDVRTVLNGRVDESSMEENVLDHLRFALGGGSFTTCACLGEAIILNQVAYTSHLNNEGSLETNTYKEGLKSPFLMGLGKEQHPSSLFHLESQKGILLEDLFKQLGQGLLGYAFVGGFSFKTLACTYLKKAPIFNEPINEHVKKYWAETEYLSPCTAYVFGVVITEKGKQHFPPENLNKAFYLNPLEQNSGEILSHTHAALVKKLPTFNRLKEKQFFYEKVDASSVIGVRHIFTHSLVKEGTLALFDIHEM
ncbi:MAG: hypothetical protein K2Y08_02035 [Alphaproteobacteria bacterium]|nr:hypothetical protein [Alphaproteobacteria bacterium]